MLNSAFILFTFSCIASSYHHIANSLYVVVQRSCRAFLFSSGAYQQRLQSVLVLQSGVRKMIAMARYKRMRTLVCILFGAQERTFVSFSFCAKRQSSVLR